MKLLGVSLPQCQTLSWLNHTQLLPNLTFRQLLVLVSVGMSPSDLWLLYRQGRKFESDCGDCAQINKDIFFWGRAFCRTSSIFCFLPGLCISSQHHMVNSHSSATLLVEQTVAVACNLTVWSLLWHLLANPDPGRTQLSQLERPATVSNPNCSCRSCKRMQGEIAGWCLCPLCFLCSIAERIKRHTQVTLAPPYPRLCSPSISLHCDLMC